MTLTTPLPFWKAAKAVLEKADAPLDYHEITRRALEQGLVQTEGKTPEASMNSQIAVNILRRGDRSAFVRTAPGVFGLRSWADEGRITAIEARGSDDSLIRIPHYPRYSRLRMLLPVLDGVRREELLTMMADVYSQRGTPQEPVDWTDPDCWIEERLDGRSRELAARVWRESGHEVNPRHLRGSWLLATNYRLVETSSDGSLHLTERGRDFLDHPQGATVHELDSSEGMDEILKLVAERGPASRAELLPPFTEYANEQSNLRAETSIKSFLWARLRNLLDRELVERNGHSYAATPAGLAWLDQLGTIEDPVVEDTSRQILRLTQEHRRTVREHLREQLLEMDPFAFEHLIKNLLESMDYEDVEVTAKSGDGGVDVIGRIQLGITEIREVVQVKRHQRKIQRSTLDALRGCLHRFGAVRGTIITTSDFARGTKEAAFEPGGPITLINGEKVIDLMIEHRVGVKKKPFELLEIDLESLQSRTDEDEDEGG